MRLESYQYTITTSPVNFGKVIGAHNRRLTDIVDTARAESRGTSTTISARIENPATLQLYSSDLSLALRLLLGLSPNDAAILTSNDPRLPDLSSATKVADFWKIAAQTLNIHLSWEHLPADAARMMRFGLPGAPLPSTVFVHGTSYVAMGAPAARSAAVAATAAVLRTRPSLLIMPGVGDDVQLSLTKVQGSEAPRVGIAGPGCTALLASLAEGGEGGAPPGKAFCGGGGLLRRHMDVCTDGVYLAVQCVPLLFSSGAAPTSRRAYLANLHHHLIVPALHCAGAAEVYAEATFTALVLVPGQETALLISHHARLPVQGATTVGGCRAWAGGRREVVENMVKWLENDS